MARNYNNQFKEYYYNNSTTGDPWLTPATDVAMYTPIRNTEDGDAYYAKKNFNLNSSFSGHVSADDLAKDWFIWTPSNGVNIENPLTPNVVQFGDGYIQRGNTFINNQRIVQNWSFENRPFTEANGLLHFLAEKGGVDNFLVSSEILPLVKIKDIDKNFITYRFICLDFKYSINFYNNFTITCQVMQVFE